jgi:hypothetical protein
VAEFPNGLCIKAGKSREAGGVAFLRSEVPPVHSLLERWKIEGVKYCESWHTGSMAKNSADDRWHFARLLEL